LAYFFHRIIFSLREGVRLRLGYCVFGQPEIVLSTARKTDRKGEPKIVHYARVRRFSFFAFTSSPIALYNLIISKLSVKDSPDFAFTFPSPVFFRKWLLRKG